MSLRGLSICSLCVVIFVFAQSCASVIGADEKLANAAAELCKCIPSSSELATALGPPAVCAAELSRRLESAREETRAKWLEHYAKVCNGRCQTASAPELWKQCFYQPPTCSKNDCRGAAECCGFESGETCNADLCTAPGEI